MRLLVACESCKRQYDASGLVPDSRFRCLCGSIVEVIGPEAGHDAAVVRCSACGAPRQAASTSCHYCGADFTLHERDLHTICPGCMARVSDRARFCHHCATPLLPAGDAGAPSDSSCPACGSDQRLTSRRIGEPGIGVLECPTCAGLWLAANELELLLQRVRSTAASTEHEIHLSPYELGDRTQASPQGALYRPCPVCGKLMHRRNFGRKSGVIVDHCRPHGFWFDATELEAILQWVRRGGEIQVERLEREEEHVRRRRLEMERRFTPVEAEGSRGYGGTRTFIDLLTWLATVVG